MAHPVTISRPCFPHFTRLVASIQAGRSPSTLAVTRKAISQINNNPGKFYISRMDLPTLRDWFSDGCGAIGKVWPMNSYYVDDLQTISDLRLVRRAGFLVLAIQGPNDSPLKIPMEFVDDVIKCPSVVSGWHSGAVSETMRETMFGSQLIRLGGSVDSEAGLGPSHQMPEESRRYTTKHLSRKYTTRNNYTFIRHTHPLA